MISLTLKRYESGSVIVAADVQTKRHLGQLTYTRNIHQYESESDYKRMISQMNTYGDHAAMEEFDRIKAKQNQGA